MKRVPAIYLAEAKKKLVNVRAIAAASTKTGVPFAVACALIEKESGGKNIYGHDPGGTFYGKGTVTQANWRQFRKLVVEQGKQSNGVGPAQITYRGFFLQMEEMGLRPYKPADNIFFGVRLLQSYFKTTGSWEKAGAIYNGGPKPNAQAIAYGASLGVLIKKWEKIFAAVTPTPGEEEGFTKLKFVQASMLYKSTKAQKQADFDKIMALEPDVVCFTEAGEDELWFIIRDGCRRRKYNVFRYRSNVVAVSRKIVKPGTWETGSVFVADNDDVKGPGHDSAFPWATWEHRDERVGKISVASIHYPTQGRREGDPNWAINRLYSEKLVKFAEDKGQGRALVFVSGDFNMPDDKDNDLFFGGPLTTAGDELKKWGNTGHGAIDATASYDKDGRVSAFSHVVLNERRFRLYTDHFPVVDTYKVQHLPAA